MDTQPTQTHGSDTDTDDPKSLTAPFTYGDLIVDYLKGMGVSHVFGVPGGSIEPFFDAVARAERRNIDLKMVVSRHETGAAFMVDGHIRETGLFGVCCSTTGPGATNLITGVANAWEENLPMLVITAQTPMTKFGKKALQDSSCSAIDVVGMFKHCTKYSTLVSHINQLENKLITAFMTANTPPKGPVHISLPADIVNTQLPILPDVNTRLFEQTVSISTPSALEQLKSEIGTAERILLFVGENCKLEENQLTQFAEQINAAIVSDPTGKRWVDETHPRYCGVFGLSGHQKARSLVMDQKYNMVLALGAQIGELGTSSWSPALLSPKLIHIDDSTTAFSRTPNAHLHICGVLSEIIGQLTTSAAILRAQGKRWQDLTATVVDQPLLTTKAQAAANSNAVPLKPQRAFHSLGRSLPEDTRIFIDAGNAWAWSIHYMQRTNTQGLFRIAMAYGSMTWAIGASVGSCVSNPADPHLCITGDGSYLMAGQEITVAIQQQVPLVMIILNDTALGMVKHGQRLGRAEETGFTLPSINYAALANALGIEGLAIETPRQLDEIDFDRLFSKNAPTIIDLRIDPEEVPPLAERIKGIAACKS